MKRLAVILGCLVVLTAAIGTGAGAQYTAGELRGRYGVGFGLFHPIDPNLRDYGRWMLIRGTYAMDADEEGRPKMYASAQWIAPTKDFGDIKMVPITINKIFRPSKKKESGYYLVAGAGIYWLSLEHYDFLERAFKDYTATKFGATIGAGVDLNPSSRIELCYTYVQPFEDTYPYTYGGNTYRLGFSFSGISLSYTLNAF